MVSRCRFLLWCASFLLAAAAIETSAAARDYDWDRYRLPDPSQWETYFRSHARLQLGPERRLRNGISWRLVTDAASGIAMPRLTWMPDRRRLGAANRLLEKIHGGEMQAERIGWHEVVESENAFRRNAGVSPLSDRHGLYQKDIGLTYVGQRLMSLMEAAQFAWAGNHPDDLVRGLTFDLDKGLVALVSSCDSAQRYGFHERDYPRGNFTFRYGDLLDLCDPDRYRTFITLVKEIDDARTARHLSPSANDRAKGCVEYPDHPLVREQQEYVLYLTFAGLAVQVSGGECPTFRTPDNPIIVPYRQLESFLLPGPWRDELLALR